jgi:hypothetical protein
LVEVQGELGTVIQMPVKAAVKASMVMPIMVRRAWGKMLAVWPEEVMLESQSEDKAVKGESDVEGRGNDSVDRGGVSDDG